MKDIVEDSSGNELTCTLSVPTGNKVREQISTMIQSNLKEIGINIVIESMDYSSLITKVVKDHDFDLCLLENALNLDPDPKPFWNSTSSSNEKVVISLNISGFSNKEADKLIDNALVTFDRENRIQIYNKFEKLLNEQVPWVYLYSQNTIKAYNPKLKKL